MEPLAHQPPERVGNGDEDRVDGAGLHLRLELLEGHGRRSLGGDLLAVGNGSTGYSAT